MSNYTLVLAFDVYVGRVRIWHDIIRWCNDVRTACHTTSSHFSSIVSAEMYRPQAAGATFSPYADGTGGG